VNICGSLWDSNQIFSECETEVLTTIFRRALTSVYLTKKGAPGVVTM
jgi:hypothetical protein